MIDKSKIYLNFEKINKINYMKIILNKIVELFYRMDIKLPGNKNK